MRLLALARFHRIVPAIGIWGASVLMAPAAAAQDLTLTISPSTITFAAADPDTTPSIAAPAITVRYRVRNNEDGSWRISLQASGDLTDGSATIPITNVTWTASPTPPFQAGTLSQTLAQTLASGSGDVQAPRTGTTVFRLANSWTYNVGNYSTSVVFTLTAP